MSDHLDRYIQDKKVRRDPEQKYTIENDRWDKRVAQQIAREVKEYRVASGQLGDKVDTGFEAMIDTLYSLYKVNPHQKDPNQVRSSYMINHRVIEEMMGLKEYEKFRPSSMNDMVGAGLACSEMEPELEILFDKMDEAQKLAQQIEQTLQDIEAAEDNIDDLMERAEGSEDEEEVKNFQEQAASEAEQLEALKEALAEQEGALANQLDIDGPEIRRALKSGLEKANDRSEAEEKFDSWGLQPGTFKRLDAKTRIELSNRLQSNKFQRMAEIFGRMQNVAIEEQMKKVDYAREELYELEQGSDLPRVIPTEMLMLNDDTLAMDFFRRYVEQSLIQYALRGEDKVVKGGILLLEDGSSSMSGDRETWAKAIGLALLKISMMQKRPFHGVQFGGPGQYMQFEFDTTNPIINMKMYHKDVLHSEHHGPEAVIEYADKFIASGGTDFMTPMSVALDRLNAENDATGAVGADIVFLTDGECRVPDDFLKEFKAQQNRLGFKVYGIAIGTNPKNEPLYSICDGFVIGLNDLKDAGEMRPLFGRI